MEGNQHSSSALYLGGPTSVRVRPGLCIVGHLIDLSFLVVTVLMSWCVKDESTQGIPARVHSVNVNLVSVIEFDQSQGTLF